MDLGIAGKVAFVSGGSKGAGRATAELLAKEGCRVVIAAREQRSIDLAVEAICNSGGVATGVSADLTDKKGIDYAVQRATDVFGPPDIAICNVHGPGSGDFSDLCAEDFTTAFNEMTLSMFHLARAVVPHMRQQKWGRLVNIGSYAPKEPPPELKHLLANTVRASVITMNKSLANEFGPDGITVNTIGTGFIGTERMHTYVDNVAKEQGKSKDEMLAEFTRNIPVRRVGLPEEMAAMIAFLCSKQAAYVTGNLIPVDGGIHRSAW